MSQTALTDFARIAQQLADALDKHRPTQGNQTLVVLSELANQLPEDNPLRLSIEQQMAKIAATDFALDNQDLNKTLIILGTLKGRLDATDLSQEKIDVLMAKILAAKFDIVNGQQDPGKMSTAESESEPQAPTISIPEPPTEPETPSTAPSITIPEPPAEAEQESEPESEPAPATEEPAVEPQAPTISIPEPPTEPETPSTAPSITIPEPPAESQEKSEPEAASAAEEQPAPSQPASPAADFADQVHTLQLALDQLPASTRQAFDELKAIEDQGGTIQAMVDGIVAQSNGDNQAATERLKAELERLSILIAKIEDAPAEADQFQVLYDQVDAKHKDLKTGVFSIFQREYGGNARRFVVERTAQYAKYVPADESRQRMIEDLHKLIEQAQKSLGQAPAKGGSDKDKPKSSNRAFFHG